MSANQLGGYVDWFPFGNGFHVTGGVHVRKFQAVGHRQSDTGLGKFVTGKVKYPSVAPYLGVGWGYHNTQKRGFGVVFDLGVTFLGEPGIRLLLDDTFRKATDAIGKLIPGAKSERDALLAGERRKLLNMTSRFKLFPQAYVGVSYRF